MSISPRSRAKGLKKLPYFKYYNVLKELSLSNRDVKNKEFLLSIIIDEKSIGGRQKQI